MRYLETADYLSFGLSEETPDALVVAASAMIDAFCRRASLGTTTYTERIRFRRSTSVQVSNGPLAAVAPATSPLISVRVRLARVPESCGGSALLQIAQVMGVGSTWTTIDPSTIDASPDGNLCFQPNLLGVPFDEAEVTYTAGYATVPAAVKVACAQIVRNAQAMPALNVKRQSLDSLQMEYFAGTLIDDEVQSMLRPYMSQRVG